MSASVTCAFRGVRPPRASRSRRIKSSTAASSIASPGRERGQRETLAQAAAALRRPLADKPSLKTQEWKLLNPSGSLKAFFSPIDGETTREWGACERRWDEGVAGLRRVLHGLRDKACNLDWRGGWVELGLGWADDVSLLYLKNRGGAAVVDSGLEQLVCSNYLAFYDFCQNHKKQSPTS